jgi:hypothetical protein
LPPKFISTNSNFCSTPCHVPIHQNYIIHKEHAPKDNMEQFISHLLKHLCCSKYYTPRTSLRSDYRSDTWFVKPKQTHRNLSYESRPFPHHIKFDGVESLNQWQNLWKKVVEQIWKHAIQHLTIRKRIRQGHTQGKYAIHFVNIT